VVGAGRRAARQPHGARRRSAGHAGEQVLEARRVVEVGIAGLAGAARTDEHLDG
jgi:DNA-binding FadR family transcriptional regulator